MNAPDKSLPPTIHRGSAVTVVRKWLVSHWILHLTLITVAGLFILPFAWMLGMSLKTDEEATSRAIMPTIPTYREKSPYVVERDAPDRPEGMSRARWEALQPELLKLARQAVDAAPLPPGSQAVDTGALQQAAAAEATIRALSRIDQALFAADGSDSELVARFKTALSPADVATAIDDRFGRLELRGLQARSLSGHVVPIPAKTWKVETGSATLIPGSGDYTILQYDFASSQPIVLNITFDAGVAPQDLHRLIFAMKGDASWHRFDADLRLGNQRFTSDQTTYIAQHRSSSMLLQPPTFQDDTLANRTWVPMKPTGGPSPNPQSEIRNPQSTAGSLTLTLSPSSTARAIYGKLERNYARAFRAIPFWTYVGNSVILVVLQMGGALFSSGFVAYAFARLNWPGRSIALGILLSTMMLPGQVTMIPSFLIWKTLGWYNTLNPLWIGAWLGNAFFIFLMVQHMRTIPKELDEAARIDGMNAVQTWWYVIMPQVKPTLAAIAIMTFMGAWNEFMGPLIMLRDQTKFPLSLGLFSLRIDSGEDWSLIMAGNLLMTAPVILIFFLFQRYFIEGVTVSGMKG